MCIPFIKEGVINIFPGKRKRQSLTVKYEDTLK